MCQRTGLRNGPLCPNLCLMLKPLGYTFSQFSSVAAATLTHDNPESLRVHGIWLTAVEPVTRYDWTAEQSPICNGAGVRGLFCAFLKHSSLALGVSLEMMRVGALTGAGVCISLIIDHFQQVPQSFSVGMWVLCHKPPCGRLYAVRHIVHAVRHTVKAC